MLDTEIPLAIFQKRSTFELRVQKEKSTSLGCNEVRYATNSDVYNQLCKDLEF